jgi:hypothetical protein
MLGTQVVSDLDLDKTQSVIPTRLKWGADAFQKCLKETTHDAKTLKKRQLPLAALKKDSAVNESVRTILNDLSGAVTDIEDCIGDSDPLAVESIGQIFYGKQTTARFLNSNNLYLNLVLFWKTVFLPGFAILAPLIGILVPFFIFKLFGREMSVPDYILHVRGSILKQMNVPQFFKSRYEGDRLGGFFEMLFVGFALIMFISGIWNQVTAAIHLRSIWFRLSGRGASVVALLQGVRRILEAFKNTKGAVRGALRDLIFQGERALAECSGLLDKSSIVCAGTLWNDPSAIFALRDWLGAVDAYTAIASLPVCIVKYGQKLGLEIKGLIHPFLSSCVQNNYSSAGHSVLTGPNRGGKSTFCKALGLSLITAQSWGFAWAEKMSLQPFGAIHTALEPAGKLGYASTFEAEIVFAKSVLAVKERPLFVMMDEIFHSTNAVDGVRASGVFMEALYSKQDCVSLISTHYRELATSFTGRCASYQMLADEGGDGGSLIYSYKIAEGVSSKSSVDELLRAHGLLGVTPGSSRVSTQEKNGETEKE